MKEIINKLEKLGFTNYESKVFLVLMKGHNMTAAEVAKEANIPRTSVYDILKMFTEKGLCNEIETPSKLRYEMIDPEVVEDKLERELNKKYKSNIEELKSSFTELRTLYKKDAPKEKEVKVELLRGFNMHRQLKYLNSLKESKKEILTTNRLESRVNLEQDEEVTKFYKRGGIIRSIYEISTDFKVKIKGKWVDVDLPGLVETCETFEKNGEKVKLINRIPQNFTVFDSKAVFINLVDETITKHNRSDIIVKNERFAKSMEDLFNFYWEKSMTVQEFKKTL